MLRRLGGGTTNAPSKTELDLFSVTALTSAAVQAAVDAAAANGGGTVTLPPGSGDFSAQVLVSNSNVRIRGAGRGRTTIRTTYASGGDARVAAFAFKGSIPAFASPTATLTANAVAMGGSNTFDIARAITVDHTTGLAAGDVVLVGDNNTVWTWSNTGWTNRYRGEFQVIESVTSTTITFASPLRDAYLMGNSAGVWKPTLLTGVSLRDLTVTCDDPVNHDAGAAYFDLCQDPVIERAEASNLGTWGFKMDRCYGPLVNDVVAHDLRDVGSAQGYGVIFQGTGNGRVTNSRFYRCRHGFTTGGMTSHVGWTRNTLVENCVSTDCTNTGFDNHPWTTDLSFVGCRSERNTNGGFALRGQRTSVIGCSTAYNNAAGVSVFLQAAKKNTVQGLVSHGDVNGVSIGGNGGGDGCPSDTSVIGCEIIDARLPGIFMDPYAGIITNTRIQRNTIVSPHRGGGTTDTYAAIKASSTGGAGTITGTQVIDNHGVSCNRLLSVPTLMTGTVADGNRLSQATGTSPAAIIIESGAALATDAYKTLIDPGSGTSGQVLTRQSDGSNAWSAVATGTSKLLAVSTPTITAITNTTTETTLASLTVAAAQVAAGDVLVFEVALDTMNNTAGAVNFTFRYKLGATTVFAPVVAHPTGSTSRFRHNLRAVISLASLTDQRWGATQIGTGGASGSTNSGMSALNTALTLSGTGLSTEDLSADKNLVASVEMASANTLLEVRLLSASVSRRR